MTLLRDAREEWAAQEPQYAALAEAISELGAATLIDLGIPFERKSWRVKDSDSLMRKMLRKQYTSLEEVTDRAGVRFVLRFEDDVAEACSGLQRSLGGILDDKRERLGVDTFDYRSVHLQVRGMPDGRWKNLECEVQIRTVCEDAWAVMSHFLYYKQPVETEESLRRAHAALAALFELADREYVRQRTEIMNNETTSPVAVLWEIEKIFKRFSSGDFDRELSLSAIELLLGAYPRQTPAQVVERVADYVVRSEDWLKEAYLRAENADARSIFVTQPESLLVAERLSERSEALLGAWEQRFPIDELEILAGDFGYPLPGE